MTHLSSAFTLVENILFAKRYICNSCERIYRAMCLKITNDTNEFTCCIPMDSTAIVSKCVTVIYISGIV